MKREREIIIDGQSYPVILSDEKEVLLAAKAAGRAFVAVLGDPGENGGSRDFYFAPYAVEQAEDADAAFLERVVRRHLGRPWIIARSERILLREFTLEDLPRVIREETDTAEDQSFSDPERLAAYIRHQYGFYEYGMWAVIRKSDGALLGKAGVCDCRNHEGRLELGYHLFAPYRGHGYAREACRLILNYVKEQYGIPLCAFVKKENPTSIRLLEDLGFELVRSLPENLLYYELPIDAL